MSEQLISSIAAIATAIIGLAIIAVLVSRNANTSGVATSIGQAFSGALSAAEAPVSGGSLNVGGTYYGGPLE